MTTARGDSVPAGGPQEDLLPTGPCPACEREVLACPADDGEGERWCCVRCDGPIARVEWVDESALGRLGYDVRDPLASGCGTGCGTGCGSRARTLDEMLAFHRRL